VLGPNDAGVAKVIEQKHWPSDVAGGLLVAVAIASLSARVYELGRADQPRLPSPLAADDDDDAQ
jgi:membrane-associated phospholipid phosphatase